MKIKFNNNLFKYLKKYKRKNSKKNNNESKIANDKKEYNKKLINENNKNINNKLNISYLTVYEKNGNKKNYVVKNNNNIKNTTNNIIEYDKFINISNKKNNSKNFDSNVKKNKFKKIKKGSIFLFIIMILLSFFNLKNIINSNKKLNEESYEVFSNIENNDILKNSEQSSVSNNNDTKQIAKMYSKENNNSENSKIQNNKLNKNKNICKTNNSKSNNQKINNLKKEIKLPKLEFLKPLDGEILKIYSNDKVIYSKTLELWKTHDGIDIKANKNDIVKSIEKGIVEKVYDDSFYGKTVVIDHGQGYKSCYCNLDNDVFVKEKQVINKQTKIGKVGNTSIGEIKDDLHLHFMLFKNNINIDPTFIFRK